MFEDSEAGITAAREGGMYVVGLGEREQVKQAHFTLANPGDILLDDLIETAQRRQPYQPTYISQMKEV